MNWLDGLALTWHWHGCGFKSWRTLFKLNFIFANFSFGFEYEELKETIDEWTT